MRPPEGMSEENQEAWCEGVEAFAGDVCKLLDDAHIPRVDDAHTAVEQVMRRLWRLTDASYPRYRIIKLNEPSVRPEITFDDDGS